MTAVSSSSLALALLLATTPLARAQIVVPESPQSAPNTVERVARPEPGRPTVPRGSLTEREGGLDRRVPAMKLLFGERGAIAITVEPAESRSSR